MITAEHPAVDPPSTRRLRWSRRSALVNCGIGFDNPVQVREVMRAGAAGHSLERLVPDQVAKPRRNPRHSLLLAAKITWGA